MRQKLFIFLFLLGCILLGLSGYWGFHEPPAPPPDALASTPDATTPDNPAPAPAPPAPNIIRANTIVSTPFSNRPELAPTLVTVHIDETDLALALARLASAAPPYEISMPQRVPTGIDTNTTRKVSLHLNEQPLLEALLQLQTQAPILFFLNNPGAVIDRPTTLGPVSPNILNARYETQRPGPDIWTIAGPFAFGISSLSTYNGRIEIGLQSLIEPRVCVTAYPLRLEYVSVLDDRGNSLLHPTFRDEWKTATSRNQNGPLHVTLATPPAGAKSIKTFRALAHYTIMPSNRTASLVLDDPINATPTTKSLEGLTWNFAQPAWNKDFQYYSFNVTVNRGTFAGDWPSLARALASARLQVSHSTGRPTRISTSNLTIKDDTASLNYDILFPQYINTTGATVPALETGLAVTRIVFDIPLDTFQVAVPVEFHDLPLP